MNLNKNKQIIISLMVLLVGALLYFGTGNNKAVDPSLYFGSTASTTEMGVKSGADGTSNSGVAKTYKDPKYNFSIRIPSNAKTTSFAEAGGDTILVQSDKYQMQIYVSSFDENISLTIGRVKKDIPDIKMQEPMEIETGGVATVAFISNDRGAPYREIWFVNKGYLYQVLAPAGEDAMTATIMQSWVWN
jgi:hypothetical protein